MSTRSQQLGRNMKRFVALHFRPIAAAAAALIFIAGYLVFLSPKVAEIRTVGFFDLQRARSQLELKQRILETTNALTKKYSDLSIKDAAALTSLLPAEPELPELFVQTEALATVSGLLMENVNFSLPTPQVTAGQTGSEGSVPTPAPAASPTARPIVVASNGKTTLKQLSVTFTASGGRGYSDLKKFLTTIESSSRIFDVLSLSYTPVQTDQVESYLINAVTYFVGK